MKLFLALMMTLGLVRCGGGYNPDKEKLSQAQELGGSPSYDLGNNKWLMAESISSIDSGANFELSFTLSDGGSLTLHTFSDSQLARGVDFKFVRDLNAFKVFVSASGTEQEWNSYFATVDASAEITLTLDVHNNEHPAHVLVWQGSKNSGLDHTNTLYNSAEDSVDLGYDGSPGNGQQRSWGISYDQAVVTRTLLSSPQETHE